MTFKRALAIALTAAAVLPASAGAQAQITPPDGDNYLGPIALSDFENPGKFPTEEIGFVADTSSYTVQDDLFAPPGGGGPPEPHDCGIPGQPDVYNNTIGSVFYADRYGVMKISTAGPFDAVIGFVPFEGPLTDPTPDINNGVCIDRLSGFEEELKAFVVPKQWYAVQVGGTGATAGGQLQVKFDYQKPPTLDADAVLTWKSHRSGAKVVKLEVSAPRGSKVSVSCTRHGCKAPRPFVVKKAPAFKPLAAVGPVAKAPTGLEMTPAGSSASVTTVGGGDGASRAARFQPKAQAHAAKKYKLLKGKILKAGSKLIIRVTQPGYIGKYFSYPVTKRGVSAKTISCTNPNSNVPRKKCG
jgi:hypothetical protein